MIHDDMTVSAHRDITRSLYAYTHTHTRGVGVCVHYAVSTLEYFILLIFSGVRTGSAGSFHFVNCYRQTDETRREKTTTTRTKGREEEINPKDDDDDDDDDDAGSCER